jgi:peptidoglycan/LPS O-acetylase OafA/YrhL
VFFLIAAAITVPLAAMSWFLIERHAMSLKRRIERKSSRPAIAAAETTSV